MTSLSTVPYLDLIDSEPATKCLLWRRHRPGGLREGGLEGRQGWPEDKGVQRRNLKRAHWGLQGDL